MESYLQKMTTGDTWESLSVRKDTLNELKSMKEQAQSGRKGAAFFYGPLSTGKAMAAGVLARELGVDLYKVDLSSIVSKYIGETEKNLSIIFEESSKASAILFFDEADALFGKRTEVNDAHDRYANVDTSYLLQLIEDFQGIVILASNSKSNIDDAFFRRTIWVTEFTQPEPPLSWWERLLGWLKIKLSN